MAHMVETEEACLAPVPGEFFGSVRGMADRIVRRLGDRLLELRNPPRTVRVVVEVDRPSDHENGSLGKVRSTESRDARFKSNDDVYRAAVGGSNLSDDIMLIVEAARIVATFEDRRGGFGSDYTGMKTSDVETLFRVSLDLWRVKFRQDRFPPPSSTKSPS